MFKILRYLKPFVLSIVFVVCLLVVQALCDLSLPDYTSNIVNVGIQQGGIENAVPEVMRENQMDKLLKLMTDEERENVEDSYTLLSKDKLSESEYDEKLSEYPNLKDENLYELNKVDKEVEENLNTIFSEYIMKVAAIEMGAKDGQIPNIPPNMDIWTLLDQMPPEEVDKINNSIDEQLNKLDDSMLSQSSIPLIRNEYEEIGLDTEKMQTNYILRSGASMLLIAAISMVATVIVGYLAAKIAAGMGRNMRKDVFRKVVGFSNTELDKFSTASLITRSTNDIQQVQTMAVMLIRMVFYAPILAIGGIIKVLDADTSMSWIIGVAIFAILCVVVVLFSLAIPRFKKVQELVDKLNLVTRERLTGMLVIRAFSTDKDEEEKFDKTNKDLRKLNTFVNRIMSIMMPTMMLIMNLITILIVWVGAQNIDAGTMQVGDMMAFIQYAMQIIMAFLFISMLSVIIPRASVSAGRINEILQTKESILDIKDTKTIEVKESNELEFKDVSFKYPNAEDDVVSNINFTTQSGEITAFIGSTGSGKSTLVNLIPRFYDVTSGSISINGIDIREISQSDLRDNIGFVPQKGVLFSGTIKSNIEYGTSELKEEEIDKVVKISQAYDFIQDKPEKFETEIAQGGTNVSGGQKQRLAIARAIAKNPNIYIFDDSFSALDLKTDAKLRKELKSETKDKIVLIVAQRVSTIMNADQIIVLDEGNMVGKGTHKELLQNCEVYKQIALSQLSKEELANE